MTFEGERGVRAWLRGPVPVAAVYVLATLVTYANYLADSADYVESIAARVNGNDHYFWEFGHLYWRPLGWLLYTVFRPLTELVVGTDVRANIFFVLLVLNWIAGLASAVLLYLWVVRVTGRRWAATAAAVGFVFSHAFLNFTQTGSSYVPGLAFLLLGLYLLARGAGEGGSRWDGYLAGAALAVSLCMWLLYLWAIPAALASPLVFFKADRRRWRLAVEAAVGLAAVLGVSYLAVILVMGIRSVAELRAWISAAAHGVDLSGLSRMVFGFARSMINMGNDGIIFKRFMVRDPYNAVSLFDIVRLSLWKFGFFYLFLAAVLVGLVQSVLGRRVLAVSALAGIPMFAFAYFFDGGAVERYMPVFPFIFLAFAAALTSSRAFRVPAYVAAAFLVVASIVNLAALATVTLDGEQERVVSRVEELLPQLRPGSRVVTSHWQDDLVNFNRAYPFNPINRDPNLRIHALMTLNTDQVPVWRQNFASEALAAWRRGGDVWISKRVFAPRPESHWNWTEGDDPRVSWNDIVEFFSRMEMGQSVGGEDGFVLLVRTPETERFLAEVAKGAPAAGEPAAAVAAQSGGAR
jgi:4-amino-4-deoxy-L-arabinose transferase-like glycosyltransferase